MYEIIYKVIEAELSLLSAESYSILNFSVE